MVLFLNTQAAGGSALGKWERIETCFRSRFSAANVLTPTDTDELKRLVQRSLELGEEQFVAAGGDGTVNALLNALCAVTTARERDRICLGALGLGSSNDYHKPFLKEQFIDGIPCKLDFANAYRRDVGCLTFGENGQRASRFFLANASSGVTAEANLFFNDPTPVLAFLKRVSTPTAILYAAIRTILTYRNFSCTIQAGDDDTHESQLTNLAVMKNPHVSGSFVYDTPVAPNSGSFAVNLSESMSRTELLHLLYSLSRGRFTSLRNTRAWTSPSVRLNAEKPVAIEYDGEVVTARSATFTVLPNHLRVCP